MLRVILVDDERLALQNLRNRLEIDVGGVEVAGMYTNPVEAVEEIVRLQPDALFLDIQMPGINGLQLAGIIQERSLDVEVVFVTAYDRYAVQAFELFALDYVMKPVTTERLSNTVKRLEQRTAGGKETRRTTERDVCRIGCFGRISFGQPGSPPQHARWRTSKAQELFAYMLHQRGTPVERETLLDLLWPDFDRARAAQQLYTTIYHIRQALKQVGANSVTIASSNLDSGYVLDLNGTKLDVEEWEDRLQQLPDLDRRHTPVYEAVLDSYTGDYLGQLEYVWAEHERERLRRLWLQTAERLALHYRGLGLPKDEIRLRRRIQQLFPYDEEHYFILMKLYDAIGDEIQVNEQYRQLIAIAGELEEPVSEEIEMWHTLWLRSSAGRRTLSALRI